MAIRHQGDERAGAPEPIRYVARKAVFQVADRYEARDDRLIQAGAIVDWVAALAPDITCEAIARRFVHSAANGGFGWRRRLPDQPHRPAKLIDLDSCYASYAPFEPVQYPLRPSVVQVEMRPLRIYATRTTWIEWLSAQELPVPRELIGTTIDHVPAPAGPAPPPVVYCNEKRPYWRRGWEIGLEWCGENGVPAPRSGMQARLEERVRYQLKEEYHVERGESTVRKHVEGWIKRWREIDFKNRPSVGLADDQRAQDIDVIGPILKPTKIGLGRPRRPSSGIKH